MMRRGTALLSLSVVLGVSVAVPTRVVAGLPEEANQLGISGTIWVTNRSANTIRGIDAASGHTVKTIRMGASPSDLVYAQGKLYVSEESQTSPAIAVVDPATSSITRLRTSRPHHVHASTAVAVDDPFAPAPCPHMTSFVSYGVYNTDIATKSDPTNKVGMIDARTGQFQEWETSDDVQARTHAAAFGPREPGSDELLLYAVNEASNELVVLDPRDGSRVSDLKGIASPHEVVVNRDGTKAYVSARSKHLIYIVGLEGSPAIEGSIVFDAFSLPDTLQITADQRTLTVGLRRKPAAIAIVDLATLEAQLVPLSDDPTSIAGHQWTSPDGHYTFAAFEGHDAGLAVIDHRRGHEVVRRVSYPGSPHGVTFEPWAEQGGRGHGCGLS